MTRAAAGLAQAAALLLATGLAAGVARGQPPETAMFSALEQVCGPAAQQQKAPDSFAEAAGFQPQAERPPGIPTVAPGLRVWRAPSDRGRVYVFAGVLPPPAEPSTCMVAVYDADAPHLTEDVARRISAAPLNFAINPRLTGDAGDYRMARYDRRVGDRIDTVQFLTPLAPAPDGPRQIVAVYSVDYGWMRKLGR